MKLRAELTKEFDNSFNDFIRSTENNIISASNEAAKETEEWGKRNAPWTDRTGNARKSIFAQHESQGVIQGVIMGIGIYYGKFLEISRGGRFRIVEPMYYHFQSAFKYFLSKKRNGK